MDNGFDVYHLEIIMQLNVLEVTVDSPQTRFISNQMFPNVEIMAHP